MTKQEFVARTGYVPVSEEEFWRIHEAYCDSSADKDVWCKAWRTCTTTLVMLQDWKTLQMKHIF